MMNKMRIRHWIAVALPIVAIVATFINEAIGNKVMAFAFGVVAVIWAVDAIKERHYPNE